MTLRRNRVVVTGLGPLCCCGAGVAAFWKALLECSSGIGPITLFDASRFRSRIAGEVKNFDLTQFHPPWQKARRLARHTQFAMVATKLALDDAGYAYPDRVPESPVPLFLGVSTSAMEIMERGFLRVLEHGPDRAPSYGVSGTQPQQAASVVAQEFRFLSETHTTSSACAAGFDALTQATAAVRGGRADFAITGGADAPITSMTFAGMQRAHLSSTRNDDPEHASRPFDRDCDSGCVAEGAGVLVLENLECALARNARIYLEITGTGSASDPDPAAPMSGLADAMSMALDNAGRLPRDVDYICAHGPGHPIIDQCEVEAIKRSFGADAYRVPVSSIKGCTGNPLAAAGPLQLIACACAVRDGLVPPTANLDNPAPGCDLDVVARLPRRNRIGCVLINSHGLGGVNTCVVAERAADV